MHVMTTKNQKRGLLLRAVGTPHLVGDLPRSIGLLLEDADSMSFRRLGLTAGLCGDRPAVRVAIDRQLASDLDLLVDVAIEVHGVLIEKITHKLAQCFTALGRFVGRKEDGVFADDVEESVDVTAIHRLYHVLGDGSDRFHLCSSFQRLLVSGSHVKPVKSEGHLSKRVPSHF